MTEGIIQKIFKKYDVMNEDIVWLLDRIEKELIAEIENIKPVWEHRLTIEYIKQLLIGDSE